MALTKLRGNIVSTGTISNAKIEDGSLANVKLLDGTITGDKIKDGTIANSKLTTPPSPGVTTGKSIAMAIVFG